MPDQAVSDETKTDLGGTVICEHACPQGGTGIVVLQVSPEQGAPVELSGVIEAALRSGDAVVAADDRGIVVVFEDAAGIDAAVTVAERIRGLILRWSLAQGRPADVSAGVAVAGGGENLVSALERAQRALTQARAGSRGRTVARSVTRVPRSTPRRAIVPEQSASAAFG